DDRSTCGQRKISAPTSARKSSARRRCSMRPDDRVRMLHIRDASDSVARFVAGRQRGDLDSDEMLLFALVRAIEIIGEAASRVSDETRQAFPAVPWSEVVAMRNRLVHAYHNVNHDILWKTATVEVPALAASLPRLADHE